jgi:hypothetical protein
MAHFPGFDIGSYPGDAAMQAWKQNSPYQWAGFYLTAPCHSAQTFTPWEGHYSTLKAMGWGLAIIYVGLQQDGCGSARLSASLGTTHGVDAVTRCQAEGFAQDAIIFLDVEHFDGSMSQAMTEYYRAWVAAVLESNFYKPGTYCAADNFNDVYLAAQQEYASHGFPSGGPAIWIVKTSSAFDPANSDATDCGISQANIWQGKIQSDETFGGVELVIDEDTADSLDPSKTQVLSQPAASESMSIVSKAGSGTDAGSIARLTIESLVDKLAAHSPPSGGARLFFPNGIDLIDVSVKAGLATGGMEISVKVAGVAK